MKRFICILLLAVIALSALVSCGSAEDIQTTAAPSTDTGTQTSAPETADTAADTEDTAEGETTVTEQSTDAPQPSPYGQFTYTENKVNAMVSAPYAILIDAKTKEILYINCEPDAKIYPASTTKVLTAIVALKHCEPDVVFKPGNELELVAKDTSIAYVKSRHELSLEMLIEGMMLPSGGDAAYVVAAGVGKKIAGNDSLTGKEAVTVFMDEMNRYAKEELGLTGSHFTCPDGYHDDDHYTTPIDIMTVAYAALSEPLIMKYAATHDDDVRYASGHKNTWVNTNSLIDPESPYFYENATGLKTGTTDEAGCCLLSSAAFGSKKVIAGVFAAESNKVRFSDSRALLTAGINR